MVLNWLVLTRVMEKTTKRRINMGNKWQFYSNMLKTYWQIPAGLILYIAATLCILHIPFPMDLAISGPQFPSIPQAMYYAMQLFVLEGIPLGTPNGAEWYYVYPLWALYFLAPFLTANFLFVFVKSLFQNPEKGITKYKGHIVVCGIGKVGNALVEKLSTSHHVVAVEKDPNCRYLLNYKKKKIPYVVGDMTVKATLHRTNISNASHIFCVSNDDMANMDAIMAVKRILKKENLGLKCICHITDMNLYANINDHYRQEPGQKVIGINGYAIAAKKIVNSICLNPDGQKECQKLIVIAGFGSMGKMVTKDLLSIGTKQSKFIIIDRREESNPINFVKYLANDDTFKGFKYDFRNCDINLPSTWDEVAVKAIKGKKDLIVILATDDDVRNVGTAMMIQNRVKRTQATAPHSNKINLIIITRLFRNVSFLDTQKENVRSFVFYDTVIDEFKQMVEKTNP